MAISARARAHGLLAASRGPVLYSVFSGLGREHGFLPLRSEGSLPPALRGTLYRNGPGDFTAGRNPHWFDGRGAVTAVRLDGQHAYGAVRLTHSPSADHDAGRARNRYAGFHQRMSWPQRLRCLAGGKGVRNMASINVLLWQGRLFALMECALPLELDPQSLATLGETDLGGVVPGAWNAHAKRVPARRATYQFGVRPGARVFLDVFVLPDAGQARRLASIPLPGMMEVHDFFATEHYLVFVLPPLWCSPLRMLWEGSGFGALRWQGASPTEVLVLPIDRPEEPVRIPTDPFFFWHTANGYEIDGAVVLDLVRYPSYAATLAWLDATPAGRLSPPVENRLWRGEVDVARRLVRWERRSDVAGEFPAVHPALQARRHRYVWMAGWPAACDGQGWPDRLMRLDVDTGQAVTIQPGGRCIAGEPTVVPRSENELDAWILSVVHSLDEGASYLGIWDAESRVDEPVARVWFDQVLPPALHGCWVPA